jgi:signal transduction histidine kinase
MRCNNRNVKLVRIASLLIVITCVIVVVAALFVRKNITSTKLAEQKFEELARDYYENETLS